MYFGYWLILGLLLIVLEIVIPSFICSRFRYCPAELCFQY